MNKEKLKSIMVLHGETNIDLAELLNITPQSVSAKMNERATDNGRKAEFRQGEIKKIIAHYNLSDEQISSIFFN